MGSSIKKSRIVSGCNSFVAVTNAAITAINNKQKKFTSGPKKRPYTIGAYFSSVNGWLSPASAGYDCAVHERYGDYHYKVSATGSSQMFHLVFDDKDIALAVINASFKSVLFSKEEHPRKKKKPMIAKAMMALNQMVDRTSLNGNLSVDGEGNIAEVAEEFQPVYDPGPPAPPSAQVLAYRANIQQRVDEIYCPKVTKKVNTQYYNQKMFDFFGFNPEKLNHHCCNLIGEFPQVVFY